MEQKRDLYSIYLDLNYAINGNSLEGALGKARDIAKYYDELITFTKKMNSDDAESVLNFIECAIKEYDAYDKITNEIYRLSNKYDR